MVDFTGTKWQYQGGLVCSMAHHFQVPIWFIHTPPFISSIISFQQKSCAICHIPLMLPRAQLTGCIFTLRPCLKAVKLLDFSLCKNSQIGLKGDLKGLGEREWGKKSKELHSLPLIAFSTEVSLHRLILVRGKSL